MGIGSKYYPVSEFIYKHVLLCTKGNRNDAKLKGIFESFSFTIFLKLLILNGRLVVPRCDDNQCQSIDNKR